jgi:Peptidase family S41
MASARWLRHVTLLGLCGCAAAAPLGPSQPSSAVPARSGAAVTALCPGQPRWAPTTRRDVDAIAAWVDGVYPAVVDPLNPGFSERWGAALAQARGRAEQVCEEAGWRATLRELLGSVRDGHVQLWPNQPERPFRWTGFAVELQGGRFLLRRASSDLEANSPPDGAELLACDTWPIAEYARRALDRFRGDWSSEALRPSLSVALLVDDGNPFLTLPTTCSVEADGQRRPWTLPWTVAPASIVGSAVAPYTRIAHDHRGLLQLELQDDGSAWITVGNLSEQERHAKLLETLTRATAEIRRAPYVVWDLRGNGGGNSSFGDALAAAVWGQGSLLPGRPPRHPKRWRASARLVQYIEAARDERFDWIVPPMKEAVRQGQALVTIPGHDDIGDQLVAVRPPAKTGPVFVLTDAGCFSSCISFRNLLTRMGAIQVGDPTARDEVYGESWFDALLPSKLGKVVLPIAIFGDHPEERGGTLPELPWHGSARDEAGIRQFIASTARGTPVR